MPVRPLLVCLAALLPALAVAQVNTERMRRIVDEGFHIQVSASGAYATGNTEFLQVNSGGRIDAVQGDHAGFIVSQFSLARANDAAVLSRAFAHIRYNNDVTPLVTAELFAQVERDEQQLLARRYLVGGGVRFNVIDEATHGFALGTTPMFELEQLREGAVLPGGDTESIGYRLSNYVTGRFKVSETTFASATTYVQPRLNDFNDVRVLAQGRLGVDVNKNLRVQLTANTRYDSRPPVGIEETDFSVTGGFVFDSIGN